MEGFDEPHPAEEVTLEISLHAIIGVASYKTILVKVTIGGQKVVVLVDSRSTHNFISEKLIQTL